MSRSLWQESAPEPLPGLERDAETDLLAIGGGMTGLFAALEGARRGARVMLVEKERIADALRARWPLAREARITHRWSGVMGFSPDALPWVGEVPGSPGLWTGFACTGHGWGYWPWAGRTLATLALEDKAEIPWWCRIERPLPAPA